MKTQTLTGAWKFRQEKTKEWYAAQVPGGVHSDLLAIGRIPDPFASDNEKHVQWVAETDWEYKRTFKVHKSLLDEEKIFLVCDGIDTLAEVVLNGFTLGQTENMFRQYHWEVKGLLQEGENQLTMLFPSPVKYINKKLAERPMLGVSQAIPGGPYLRKAPCQFGWDWGPMLPPIGIWQDIRLEGYSLARIADVHIRQDHLRTSDDDPYTYANLGNDLLPDEVRVGAIINIERWQDQKLYAHLLVTSPGAPGIKLKDQKVIDGRSELIFTDSDISDILPELDRTDDAIDDLDDWIDVIDLDAPHGDVELSVIVPQAELWWPNGYGAQPLYIVEVTLLSGEGRKLDHKVFQLGLRTVELRQEPDEWGQSFTFVINGVPIFAKGSDWIPADSFPTRVSDQHLEHLIRAAAETHQNMLRVWGGGFYEEERFYDLCDKYGLLVWQDFVFSCSIYPLNDPLFLENVHQEVIQNVRRLRHRASLALWCGNNEMEQGWESWHWDRPELSDLKEAYDNFFHRLLPKWINQEDPDNAYWPSSPSSNTPFKDVNSQTQGDTHYWDVWHGRKPFTAYRSQFPRFMSEFGFQSLPPLDTIRTYADENEWNMTSYLMEHHQRSASGNATMITQMSDTFRMPKDFPSLVYLSLVLQAEGIRYGVEHWRRNKERVSGTIYWQLNDCWPVASWASLDYFGRWKALHYAARRFYAPVLLSIKDEGMRMEIHVTSDAIVPFNGTIHWELVTLGGDILKKGQQNLILEAFKSTEVIALQFDINEDQRRDVVFLAELWQSDSLISRQLVSFVPNKHLKLCDPQIKTVVTERDDKLQFEVIATSLARFVEVALPGADVVFSDNYFDIPAGKFVIITCPFPEGWNLVRAQEELRVRSLFDSY